MAKRDVQTVADFEIANPLACGATERPDKAHPGVVEL